jgi:hypothetical protein
MGKTMKRKTEKRKTEKRKKNGKTEKKNKTIKTTPILTEHFSHKQKQSIVDALNPITEENIISSWEKLRALKCKGAIASAAGIRLGNDIVDKFTMIERLHTKGHVGIDFYTFWYNKAYFKKVGYVQNMLKYYAKEGRDITDIRVWKYIFNLYFSSITIFRPVMAMEVYCRFPCRIAVLDPTMGWGGRLVGACALDLPKYIGVDANVHFDPLYREMCDFLQPRSKTNIELFFQDALTVDYAKLKYDVVFTSPPYYNIEIYRKKGQDIEVQKTKEEWNETFYKPLFEKTWSAMQSPGYYILNVPQEVYESSCIPILGKSQKKIELKKQKRGNAYTEYIYVWMK